MMHDDLYQFDTFVTEEEAIHSSSSPAFSEEDEYLNDYTRMEHKSSNRRSTKGGGSSGSSSPSAADIIDAPSASGPKISKMNVPLFISKLYRIVQTTSAEVIGWSSEGQTFIVGNSVAFAKEILPEYFKHNNFSSFVRQLNFYGFKSSSTVSLDGRNKRLWEFRHPYFRQNGEHLLHMIKRKTSVNEAGPTPTNMKDDIEDLKAENQMMRSELTSMAEKLETVMTILRRAAMAKQAKRSRENDEESVSVDLQLKTESAAKRQKRMPANKKSAPGATPPKSVFAPITAATTAAAAPGTIASDWPMEEMIPTTNDFNVDSFGEDFTLYAM